jgi:hypothetical protein
MKAADFNINHTTIRTSESVAACTVASIITTTTTTTTITG